MSKPQEDQKSVLLKIQEIASRILHLQWRLDNKQLTGHGANIGLQKLKQERKAIEAKLDPIRLIATGISCRACRWFVADGENDSGPECLRACWPKVCGTDYARLTGTCGPEAKLFQPAVAE